MSYEMYEKVFGQGIGRQKELFDNFFGNIGFTRRTALCGWTASSDPTSPPLLKPARLILDNDLWLMAELQRQRVLLYDRPDHLSA